MTSRVEVLSWRAIALVAAATGLSGCSNDSVFVSGAVLGARPGWSVRVEYGRSWLLHQEGHSVVVDDAGRFSIPTWANAATVFADTNRNERLDPHVEPSGLCERTDATWSCTLLEQRITLLRVESGHVSPSGTEMIADNLTALLDAYDADGTPRDDAMLCVPGGECAAYGGHVLGPSGNPGRGVSPCALNAVAGTASGVPLDVTVAASTRSVAIAEPARLRPILAVTVQGQEIVVRGRAERQIDRVIGWVGDIEATEVHWSTESAASSGTLDGTSFEVRMPFQALEACHDCKAMIQAVHVGSDERFDDVTLISEVRLTVESDRVP